MSTPAHGPNYKITRDIQTVRHAVDERDKTDAAAKYALRLRNDAVVEFRLAYPHLGPTEVGRLVGLSPSTVRAVTRHLELDE